LLRNHSLFRNFPLAVIEHLGSYMKTRSRPRLARRAEPSGARSTHP